MEKLMEPKLLHVHEFWLLLSQYAPAVVLGVDNPYTGWLADEIEEANRQAVESLLERGLITETADGYDADDELLAMAEVCVHPRHTVILQRSLEDGGNEQRFIHISDKLIVEHYLAEPEKHMLGTIPSHQALIDHMTERLGLHAAGQGKGKPFKLPEALLFEVSALGEAGQAEEIRAKLKDAGLDEPELTALVDTLCEPKANSSIAVVANQGDPESQHVRGFGLLQGAADLWVMTPFESLGKPFVDFTPASIADIRERVEGAIPGTGEAQG